MSLILNGKSFHLLKEAIRINFFYSAIVNFRHFGIYGLLKMPINIQFGATFNCKSKNGVIFLKPLQLNMLTIKSGSNIEVEKGGKLQLGGERACFGQNNDVLISAGGKFEIGNCFWSNKYSEFHCRKFMRFGDNVLVSIHVMVMDTDYHKIINGKNEILNSDKSVVIGNNVWIGYNATILKGVQIGNNIVVGACALVTSNLLEDYSVYVGNPARQISANVKWLI